MDGLRRFRKRKEAATTPKETGDSDEGSDPLLSEDSDSSSFENPVKGIRVQPRLRHFRSPHNGTVNQLMCLPQCPSTVATYSDSGQKP